MFSIISMPAIASAGTVTSYSSQSNVASLEARLKSLTEIKARIEALLATLRGEKTTPSNSSATPANTLANPAIPAGLATSTLKVLTPNGGEKYFYKLDTGGGNKGANKPDVAQFIHYTTPKGMMSVDISLIKIATTTSKHTKSAYGSNFIFGKDKHNTYQGYAHLGTVKLSGKGGEQKRFRWIATAAGEGYKIVITGKVNGVTYSDSSDGIFSMDSIVNIDNRAPSGGPSQR